MGSRLIKMCACCCKRAAGPDVRPQFVAADPLRRCSKCACAFYCSRECQMRQWTAHKGPCNQLATKGMVACVKMDMPHNGVIEQVYLPTDDARFDAASESPVMKLVGIPVCVFELQRGRDNQWATYFMIDPVTGLAVTTGLQFGDMGPVLVLRRDRVPITVEQVCMLGDYFNRVIDEFGGDDDRNIYKTKMTRKAFLRFLESEVGTQAAAGPW